MIFRFEWYVFGSARRRYLVLIVSNCRPFVNAIHIFLFVRFSLSSLFISKCIYCYYRKPTSYCQPKIEPKGLNGLKMAYEFAVSALDRFLFSFAPSPRPSRRFYCARERSLCPFPFPFSRCRFRPLLLRFSCCIITNVLRLFSLYFQLSARTSASWRHSSG